MALPPSQITSFVQDEADKLEEEIDDKLERVRPSVVNDILTVIVYLYCTVNEAVGEELIYRYKKVGWENVKIETGRNTPGNPAVTVMTLTVTNSN